MASSSIERIRQKRMAVRLTVLALLVLCLIIFLAARGNETQKSAAASVLEDSVTPILAYLSMPIRGAESMLSEFQARNQVHSENTRLRQELERLKDAEIRANALSLKIAKFETLLNVDIGTGISDKKIAARAVSERNGPFVRSALINAGRNKDIAKGFAVITPDGLYGHIVRVGKRSSRALKLTDLNSRVAVMSLRSEGRAILTGDNTDSPSLSYVSNTDDWNVGDNVVTSGDDGVLPRGLPVGKVRMGQSGALKVDLNVDGMRVDWVLVIPFARIENIDDVPDDASDGGDTDTVVTSDMTNTASANSTNSVQKKSDDSVTAGVNNPPLSVVER